MSKNKITSVRFNSDELSELGTTPQKIIDDFIEGNLVYIDHKTKKKKARAKTKTKPKTKAQIKNTTARSAAMSIPIKIVEGTFDLKAAPKDLAREICLLWNFFLVDEGFPAVTVLTEIRRRKMAPALRTFKDINDWSKIMRVIPCSDFRCGLNDRGWRANFDWLFRSENYVKLSEEFEELSRNTNPGPVEND